MTAPAPPPSPAAAPPHPPAAPWVLHQRWEDLLFMHWRVPGDALRRLLPPAIPLDSYHGEAWVGVVPFRMSNVRPRWTPPLPGVSAFPELNVRTYVTLDGMPGVYFFSLDAASRMAVEVARRALNLPYFHARMTVRADGDFIAYDSRRAHPEAPSARLAVAYRPAGVVYHSIPGSLEHWLTERYCLYVETPAGGVNRIDIAHPQWPLQPADLELECNTMLVPLGLGEPAGAPLLHFARRVDVRTWLPVRVR